MSRVPTRLTLAIPSHDGHWRLPKLLESIAGQSASRDTFEVLLVDNASNVSLSSVAQAFERCLNIRVVAEPQLGANHARNRALREAHEDVVAFLDDDVTLTPNFVHSYAAAFSNDAVIAAGGPILPAYPRTPPFWLRGRVESSYSIQNIGSARDYGDRYPYGANMCFRRSALTHRFSPLLGRKGKSLLSGDETLFFVHNNLKPVTHVPEAIVFHHIDPDRLRLSWLARRAVAQIRTRRKLRLLDERDTLGLTPL